MIVNDYFFLEPDWQYDIVTGRRWRTSFQTTLERGEKRARLVDYPFKTLKFSVVPFTASENNYIRRKFYRARNKKFGVPIWIDRCSTTMEVSPTSGLTFTVDDNTLRQFEVGGLLVLWEDKDTYEVKQISSIGSNQFTLTDIFQLTWASGTYVFPIIQGRLLRSNTLNQQTTWGHSSIDIEVIEDYDADITRTVYSGNSFSTYQTYEVFNVEPNYSDAPRTVIEVYPYITQFLAKSIDYAYSVEGSINTENKYNFYNRADLYELVKLFDEKCGQWGEFWYPSWQDDVVITTPFDSADTVLDVEDIEWDSYWKDNKILGRYLYVLLPDGTEIIRKILSAPTSTSLQVDSAMGTTITSLQNVISCFLYMGRFNKDEMNIKWLSETVSEVQIGFTTIKDNEDVMVTTTT